MEFLGFPCGSAGKESACNVGDLGLVPGLGRSPGEGKGYPLQYSGLENSMDCSPWDHKESDTTERLSLSLSFNSSSPLQWRLSILSALQHFRQNMNTKLLEGSVKTKEVRLFYIVCRKINTDTARNIISAQQVGSGL